jgi:hypothetical protein
MAYGNLRRRCEQQTGRDMATETVDDLERDSEPPNLPSTSRNVAFSLIAGGMLLAADQARWR